MEWFITGFSLGILPDGCKLTLQPLFNCQMKIVKTDEYYYIFHENQYVQLHLPQIHPPTCSFKVIVYYRAVVKNFSLKDPKKYTLILLIDS